MTARLASARPLCGVLVGAVMLAAPAAHAAVTVGGVALADTGLFRAVAAQYQRRLEIAALPAHPLRGDRVRRLLAIGQVDPACSLATAHRGEDRGWVLGHAEATLARDGVLDAEDLHALERSDATEMERWVWLRALAGMDDGARVDAATRGLALAPGTTAPTPELLAAGRLAYDVLDDARAESCFTRVLERTRPSRDSLGHYHFVGDPRSGGLPGHEAWSVALEGLALLAQRRRDWDTALACFDHQVVAPLVTPGTLETLAQTLIRLGRTDEAISAAQWAVTLAPYHEAAHYLLGNGYARRDYTQLAAAYPAAFADAAGRAALAAADRRLADGDRTGARRAYAAVVGAHPGWAEARVRLASLDFEEGRFDAARDGCVAALGLCPEYGRAHAILSRALEARRLLADVHRAEYERRLAAAPMPDVPGLSRFVSDWKALSPRHQKRVALSVAPWRAYLPVLVASGATLDIKPMYLRLSECPGLDVLRDQRITYDSRLWDDVRGCGGHQTVTGIEEVERTVFDRYNTVLHEFTHQVHAILPAADQRAVLELYRAAKARDDSTHRGFLSRYAGGSVDEYLAEGANALYSPRRDAYDPREVVRERLDAIDPALRRLVEGLMARTDVSASYPVAFVRAGDDRVEHGRADDALPFYRRALERAPQEESAHAALVNALVLGDRGAEALAAAERAVRAQPASAAVRIAAAQAAWHGGRGLGAAIAALRAGRDSVPVADRPALDRALGRLAWDAGDAALAIAAFDSALARQSDDPDALRGKAAALALERRWDEAFALDERAVRVRTGERDLRRDYARDLLRAGRVDDARAQLEATRLLDPGDPVTEALRGWAALAAGQPDSARAHAARALEAGAWCDLGRIVLGAAEARLGHAEAARQAWAPVQERIARSAPPAYVFRPALARWEEVHVLPAVERAQLKEWSTP